MLPTGTVTFLFTDIEGSTKLAQRHRDTWETLRKRHHVILGDAIQLHSGYVFQRVGDACCAAFATAEDAVRAAVKAQIDLNAENWVDNAAIKVRMGIHTGKAELQETGEYQGYLTMSHVQRLMSAAHGGQVLVSLAAQNLVWDDLPRDVILRDMGEHVLKDMIQPAHIFQVVIPGLDANFPPLTTVRSHEHKTRMGLAVRLMGTFEIRFDDKPINLSSRLAQSLFAYLILNAGTAQRREKLAGMFWPDETEEKARTYLRHELWRIRKTLSTNSNVNYLLANDINISFDLSSDYYLDVAALRSARETASINELMAGLSAFQGELLPGFYDQWIVLEREHLQAVYEQKIARLLQLLESEKRWHEILEWAERWISLGQAPETAYRALMIAYQALGDHAKVATIYERCVQALRELDLEPTEQTRVLLFKRASRLNVPIPLTSFIGRAKELNEVADLLSKSRLVTLTGSGGVGKTRLSIHVVPDVLELFPDGVWFLDLAPLSDPTLVPTALANLLQLRESGDLPTTELLINYFGSRTALIIFDNCEHLIESCSELISLLLTSCEKLSILATSREALRVSGEIPYRVPSLEIPKLDTAPAIDTLMNTESMRLFTARAVVAAPDFAISTHNAFATAQICQRLDGIPLAIELAAARVNVLGVEQILKRLDDCFALLTHGLRNALPRHQTLRATIEWSYNLLSEKEQILFRRLAVFVGGWTLEAAEVVCIGDGLKSSEVLNLLSQLVDKSLVLVETQQGESRYRRLETIRQFAREKLFETAEATRLQDRHLEYFLNLAQTAEPHLRRTEQIEWLKRLEAEHDNLRAALAWAMSQSSAEQILRLTGALGDFWFLRDHLLEGAKWLGQALGKTWIQDSKAEKGARAKTLYRMADIANALDQVDIAKTSAESALALCEEIGDLWGIAYSRLQATISMLFAMSPAALKVALEKSVNEFQSLGDAWGEALALGWLAKIVTFVIGTREEFLEIEQRFMARARAGGDRALLAFFLSEALVNYSIASSDWDEAERILMEADQLYKELDDSLGISRVRMERTRILFARGDLKQAKAEAKLAIEYLDRVGEKNWQRTTLSELALIEEAENDLHSAVAHAEKAWKLDKEIGNKLMGFDLILVGKFKYKQGNVQEAMKYISDGLGFVQKGEINEISVTNIFVHLAGLLVMKKSQVTVEILALSESLVPASAISRDPILNKLYFDRFLSAARAKLSEAEFVSAWEAGTKMSLDEGIAYALRELE